MTEFCEYGANGKGRRIFRSAEVAQRTLERCQRWHAEGDPKRLESAVYLCPLTMDHWHLSSKPQFQRQRPLDAGEITIATDALKRRWG